ncbi:MAG: hypothetical protein F4213_14365 [Boseongicola sp. SB0677_bin_26]|nr:hypothetical protein [Boseongicola sp. SB0665_bin_10]MYG27188.1 hypothetical protein [Boseongicola sp. SB0677_bin_26]
MPASGYVLCSLRAMDIDGLARAAALRAGFVTPGRAATAFFAWIAASLREGCDMGRRVSFRRRGNTRPLARSAGLRWCTGEGLRERKAAMIGNVRGTGVE